MALEVAVGMDRGAHLVSGLTRLGAIAALVVFIFSGLAPSLRYGTSIGELFCHSLTGTPFDSGGVASFLVGLGTLLGGLAGLMLFVLLGALLGTAIGNLWVHYVVQPGEPSG